MAKNLRERKTTLNDDEATAVSSPAAAGAASASTGAASAVTATDASQTKKAKKYPCGKCSKEVTRSLSVHCQMCDFWFHSDCVPGMTKEYLANCKMTFDLVGHSTFLCQICRKVAAKFSLELKKMVDAVQMLTDRVTVLELEKETLAQKVENMEMRTAKVKEGLQDVEKEVVSGMEKAKEEVKKEMGREMKEREERSQNIVFYGLQESKAEGVEDRRKEELEMVSDVAREIGVDLKAEVEVKFRAGRIREGDGLRPRPLIVRVADDEVRERIFREARNLSRIPRLKSVFVAQDLTWAQREEPKKEEKELKELAEKKTEEAKKEGKQGKFLVVGQRGRRRMVWTDRVD